MAAVEKKQVIVTVGEGHESDLAGVAEQCRAAGLEVEHCLDFLGQVTGTIEAGKISQLQQVPGVIGVEESQDYQLPPPDSDVM